MKAYLVNQEFFNKRLYPQEIGDSSVNALNISSQDKFNEFLLKTGIKEHGEITQDETLVILNIKEEISKLKRDKSHVSKDRLEFDLAIIFHRNLKKLKWGKSKFDEYGMWRWLSMNFFLDEVRWRRSEEKFKKGLALDAARTTYDHLIGKRSRDIFPRRYFVIGDRLISSNGDYGLIEELSLLSQSNRSGGFGNLILNLIDTKLISPNDHVSKVISKALFTNGKLAEDKEVVRAFRRYNGFKKRLINAASEELFEKEICIG